MSSDSNHMKHILFVCSQNRLRSPTAEQVYCDVPGFEVTSAGLNHDAEVPVTGELVEWADLIFVMERTHRTKLSAQFKRQLKHQRIVCLNIPDEFGYMDPALVALLRDKVDPYFYQA